MSVYVYLNANGAAAIYVPLCFGYKSYLVLVFSTL
jgi:hypothetical protein